MYTHINACISLSLSLSLSLYIYIYMCRQSREPELRHMVRHLPQDREPRPPQENGRLVCVLRRLLVQDQRRPVGRRGVLRPVQEDRPGGRLRADAERGLIAQEMYYDAPELRHLVDRGKPESDK